MIKLFASDLDGTLLNEAHDTDEIIMQGLAMLHEKGYDFAVATGRNKSSIQMIDALWNAPVYFVSMNGALIMDKKHNIVFESEIPKHIIQQMLEEFPEVFLEYVGENLTFMTMDEKSFISQNVKKRIVWKRSSRKRRKKQLQQFHNSYRFSCSKEEILQQKILKVNCMVNHDSEAQRLAAFVQEHDKELVNAPFHPAFFEITNRSVNKAEGLRKLCQILGYEEEEAAVFGDGGNDIVMLQAFSHSYAMANGSEEAKQAAREVIGDNIHHGVIVKIEELIKENIKKSNF